MGISRASFHKRRATGGKRKPMRKKRKFEMGRPPAMTKLGSKRIHLVRGRGGNYKHRALRLDTGNFSWGTEAITRKTRILAVSYNASNNELVRTNTLVKNSIIQIDATPFRQWYEKFYGLSVGKKKTTASKEAKTDDKKTGAAPAKGKDSKKRESESAAAAAAAIAAAPAADAIDANKSKSVIRKLHKRQHNHVLEQSLDEQFTTGRLLACISSGPGQSGRCDGYILEGKELEFYLKKIQKKKSAKA